MAIPCFLTVFELTLWVDAMIADCRRLGLEPVIIDNGSESNEAKDWLNSQSLEIIRVGHNGGARYVFSGLRERLADLDYFVVSDTDLDLSGVPDNAIEMMRLALSKNLDVAKVGLSLEISDIPDSHPLAKEIRKCEGGYWKAPCPGGAFHAAVDTTFALYASERFQILNRDFYSAIRMDRPFTARHLPWYISLDDPVSDQLLNYWRRCNNYSLWSRLMLRKHDEIMKGRETSK